MVLSYIMQQCVQYGGSLALVVNIYVANPERMVSGYTYDLFKRTVLLD
jgi:hypothetical protein